VAARLCDWVGLRAQHVSRLMVAGAVAVVALTAGEWSAACANRESRSRRRVGPHWRSGCSLVLFASGMAWLARLHARP
jgi:hypothetical protein